MSDGNAQRPFHAAGEPVYLRQITSRGLAEGGPSSPSYWPRVGRRGLLIKSHLDIFKQMRCKGLITLKNSQRKVNKQRKFHLFMFGKEKHQGELCCCLSTMPSWNFPFLAFTKSILVRELLSYIAIEKNKIERCRQNEDWMAEKAYGCTEKALLKRKQKKKHTSIVWCSLLRFSKS